MTRPSQKENIYAYIEAEYKKRGFSPSINDIANHLGLTAKSNIHRQEVILLDPMLATGGTAIQAISLLKKNGVSHVKFMCIIASPEGVKALQTAHPETQIYCASIDERLDEHGYIVPGLGDAGDRLFGTK